MLSLFCYLSGVLAAMQLGKLAVLAPALRVELSLGIVQMAMLVSMIETCGALFGYGAGAMAQRIGPLRALVAGAALFALTNLAMSLLEGTQGLVLVRLVEALAYLAVVVCAPTIMRRYTPTQQTPLWLAVWGTFVPVGLALGAAWHSAVAQQISWRAVMAINALPWILLAGALLLARRGARAHTPEVVAPVNKRGRIPAWAVRLCLAYAAFVALRMGLLTQLPTLLTAKGMDLPQAGLWTGVAALAGVPGSLMAVRLVSSVRRMTLSLVLPAVLLAAAFGISMGPVASCLLIVSALAVMGIFGAAVFVKLAQVPSEVGGGAKVYGLLTQLGATGSLLGPPLLASIEQGFGARALSVQAVLLLGITLWAAGPALRQRQVRLC
jgi:MFS transporter, CP family, cyanate transporter